MLYLATSCLQTWGQIHAFVTLLSLGPDGIQLTGGHAPSAGFEQLAREVGAPLRFHHAFAWAHYKGAVFHAGGEPRHDAVDWSLHPPGRAFGVPIAAWLERRARGAAAVEVMYPGEPLGTGAEVEMAMALGVPLAVDVSHVHIQRAQGVMGEATLGRLLAYERVVEVHASANGGARDEHRPLREGDFGLDYCRERLRAGTPVVLECAMHGLGRDNRLRQVDLLR